MRIQVIFALTILVPLSSYALNINGSVVASSVTVSGSVTFSTVTALNSTFYSVFASSGAIASNAVSGTNTNDNSPAGRLGEYVESIACETFFPASDEWGDMTSISLTRGDWDVFVSGGLTTFDDQVNTFSLAVSTTAGNSTAGISPTSFINEGVPVNATSQTLAASISPFRISLSTTTYVYLKYESDYGVFASTPVATGRISARRVR